jgi:hypothetical protein
VSRAEAHGAERPPFILETESLWAAIGHGPDRPPELFRTTFFWTVADFRYLSLWTFLISSEGWVGTWSVMAGPHPSSGPLRPSTRKSPNVRTEGACCIDLSPYIDPTDHHRQLDQGYPEATATG